MWFGLQSCRHVNKTFALITVSQRKLLRNDLGRKLQHSNIDLRYILKIISTVYILRISSIINLDVFSYYGHSCFYNIPTFKTYKIKKLL